MADMRSLAIAGASMLFGITLLPIVLASGDAPIPLGCVHGVDLETVLTTIRTLESGGNYTARAARSTASGAYQFIDGTWNGYAGYTHAADAPPAVQDAKAAEHVTDILTRHNGNIAAVPVTWYIGHLPSAYSAEWDTVPYPAAGNRLTPRQYQQRWLNSYRRLLDPDGNRGLGVERFACAEASGRPRYSASNDDRHLARLLEMRRRFRGPQNPAAEYTSLRATEVRGVGPTMRVDDRASCHRPPGTRGVHGRSMITLWLTP
jgi:hypothetical protein